ncbi:MAG: hypothetical protein JWN04_4299 [Myxococcaceae bacterium]|nr:hypothetical protein [Myxococcaceae bacterium]
MSRLYLALAMLGFLSLSACAGTAKRARSEVDRSRLTYARELAVERRAPIPFERFERARKAADRSPAESVARGDYQAEERLWLEIAIADAERERLSERRLEEERELLALDASILALERERQAWQQEAELRAARAVASNEAHKALARAAERPSLRVKLPREDVKLAAEALLARSELMALTLESLDAHNSGLPRLESKLREADALLVKDPDASLARADQALFYALSLFAELRGQDGGPSADEKITLAEDLTVAGARPGRGDQGLSGMVEHAFSGFALLPAAERVVERLCQLGKAHARGPLVLTVQGKNAAQAETRLRWVRERFARAGCTGQRYTFAYSRTDGEALEATWVAY